MKKVGSPLEPCRIVFGVFAFLFFNSFVSVQANQLKEHYSDNKPKLETSYAEADFANALEAADTGNFGQIEKRLKRDLPKECGFQDLYNFGINLRMVCDHLMTNGKKEEAFRLAKKGLKSIYHQIDNGKLDLTAEERVELFVLLGQLYERPLGMRVEALASYSNALDELYKGKIDWGDPRSIIENVKSFKESVAEQERYKIKFVDRILFIARQEISLARHQATQR